MKLKHFSAKILLHHFCTCYREEHQTATLPVEIFLKLKVTLDEITGTVSSFSSVHLKGHIAKLC